MARDLKRQTVSFGHCQSVAVVSVTAIVIVAAIADVVVVALVIVVVSACLLSALVSRACLVAQLRIFALHIS